MRIYTGTASVVANPTVLTGVRIGPGLLRDVPITVRHADRVLLTRGSHALVADQRAIAIPGYTVADLTYWFDVNRKTFQRAHGFEDAGPSHGVTFNWPMDTRPHNYAAWVPDTQRSVTARYAGSANRDGIATYKFTVNVPPARIRDPQLLHLLPPSMTKLQLMDITPSLQFSTKRLLSLDKLLGRLPDPVPLAYTYRSVSTFWVAPSSGIVVDLRSHEVQTLNFVEGARLVPIIPVMDMTYSTPTTTIAAAVTDARSAADQLQLVRSTLPMSLLAGGVVLLLTGFVLLLVGRKFRRPLGDEELADVLLFGEQRVPTRIG